MSCMRARHTYVTVVSASVDRCRAWCRYHEFHILEHVVTRVLMGVWAVARPRRRWCCRTRMHLWRSRCRTLDPFCSLCSLVFSWDALLGNSRFASPDTPCSSGSRTHVGIHVFVIVMMMRCPAEPDAGQVASAGYVLCAWTTHVKHEYM